MRILFIHHAFHEKTKSIRFFVDLLRELGEVIIRPDDSFNPLPQVPADLGDAERFDLVVVWQNIEPALLLAKAGIKNLLWVPMVDNGLGFNNLDGLKDVKTLCFSAGQYQQLQGMGFKQLLYAKYYPEPSTEQISDFSTIKP